MMNVVAIGLVLTTLATAGVWSPPPEKVHRTNGGDDVVLTEGHRLIVVEYEKQALKKQPITTTTQQQEAALPRDSGTPHEPERHGLVEEAKEKFKETASVLPNLGQGMSGPVHGTKEKICDAYGVCKDKLASVFGKAKERAEEVVEEAKDAREAVKEKAQDAREAVNEKAQDAREVVNEKAQDAREAVKEKAQDARAAVKEKAKDASEAVKEQLREAKENVTEAARGAVEKARGNLTEMARRALELGRDLFEYALAGETVRAAAEVVRVLGFAVAYGACVWVTFVSSHVLAGELPRQQLGVVQSKVYPVYFRVMGWMVGVVVLAHSVNEWWGFGGGGGAQRLQRYNLIGVLGVVLANMVFLEPKATKVMFERMKVEKEEGRGRDLADMIGEPVATTTTFTGIASPSGRSFTTRETTTTTSATTTTGMASADQEKVKQRLVRLSRRLGKLNSYSSFLNVLSLMGLTWHLVYLAGRLQVAPC
ncbi:hypothetical protein QJS10_CPB13g00707 [Acorus calamus]|uniref:TMEM205-like domain-containing protein n=1 Tax=Acorus calamus TaxID=4465 RepID=A0AAV9DGN4_ACOCL|nr:hypothetical protein QJS10_CPB13g00707 [Acorus calamus]